MYKSGIYWLVSDRKYNSVSEIILKLISFHLPSKSPYVSFRGIRWFSGWHKKYTWSGDVRWTPPLKSWVYLYIRLPAKIIYLKFFPLWIWKWITLVWSLSALAFNFWFSFTAISSSSFLNRNQFQNQWTQKWASLGSIVTFDKVNPIVTFSVTFSVTNHVTKGRNQSFNWVGDYTIHFQTERYLGRSITAVIIAVGGG